MKKKIKLSKIHCAGCAEALEEKINEIEEVESASVDFVSKTIEYNTKSTDDQELREKIIGVVKKFDSSLKVVDTTEEEKQEKRERVEKILSVVKIALCIAFLIAAIFVPANILWLKISLFVLSYIFVAYEVVFSALINLFKGKVLDENFLMSIATIGAFALGEYVEAVAVMLFYSIGEFFEGLAVDKSKKRIKSLLSVKAEVANLVTGDGEIVVDVKDVQVGSTIRIKPGEKVPLDSIILEGNSYLNTAALTGESREVFAKEGDEILSGSINGEGVLLAKVLKGEEDSAATKIVKLVENANKSKAKTEKFITKFSKIYTPIVVGLAVLLAVVPLIFGEPFAPWLYRALVFLVVSCPCALVLSIPLGYFAGLGSSARRGVLVKGATYLETLAAAKAVAFDKTGTLTSGEFEIREIFATEDSSEEEVLELIAYGESFSNHKIAKSIVSAYKKTINTAWVEGYREIAGKGIVATLFYEECFIGNADLLRENNIEFSEAAQSGTVVYLAKSGKYLGYVLLSDTIKPESADAVLALKDAGILAVCMLSGDSEEEAKRVASELKLDSYFAGLLPEEKIAKIEELKKQGKVIFVGDGINDAPALASSDVGVSMGELGSDAAIEASDVVIVSDKPNKLADAIVVAKKTRRITLENIVFILLIKVAVLVLSALGISGMWLAIFADVGICLLAVLNSLRALHFPKSWRKKRGTKLEKEKRA